MIKEQKALSLSEVENLVEDGDVKAFVKKFAKLKYDDASKMRKDLEAIDNIKIKQEHIVHVIDLLPEDAQDVAKIFNEVSLDEDETNKILEIVKKYK